MLIIPYTAEKLTENKILEAIKKLPESVHASIKIIKMLDEDAPFEEIAILISYYQSLSVDILRMCNSSYYGFERRISTIQEAVTALGSDSVKKMLYLALSKSVMTEKLSGYSLEEGYLWKSSVLCAYYTRYLAELFHYPDLDKAFMVGLFRDIGKIVIDEYIGIRYEDILKISHMSEISFAQAEEMCIGFNHAQIASEMLSLWNFPEPIVQAVRYHHNFKEVLLQFGDRLKDIKLLAMLHLADALTIMFSSLIGVDGLMYSIDQEALEILQDDGLDDYQFDCLVDRFVTLSLEVEILLRELSR